jgi:predicted Ser/Thr protein kinase
MGLCPDCLLKAGAGAATGCTATEGGGTFVPPTPEELAPKFPQLEIFEMLGRGGMGAVYRARQKQLDRIVALKILPPGIGEDPAFAERFAREARALAKLSHPNIVALYEFGESNGLYYFLMEYVDGMNLGRLLQAERIKSREALAIVPQICDALQYAHDRGIVHRDIKPENLLIDRRGHVKVADFGLAKLVGAESEAVARGEPGAGAWSEAGKVMGTPSYMAPEQSENPGEVDHRVDIYALGVVFYRMLTGELPSKPLEAPSRKVFVDVRLDEVVLRALEKEPGRRYQQASVLKTRVEEIASGAAEEKIPMPAGSGPMLALVAMVCAFVSGAYPTFTFWLSPPGSRDLHQWPTLIFAAVALGLGLASRQSGMGRMSVVIGGANMVLWVLFGIMLPRLDESRQAEATVEPPPGVVTSTLPAVAPGGLDAGGASVPGRATVAKPTGTELEKLKVKLNEAREAAKVAREQYESGTTDVIACEAADGAVRDLEAQLSGDRRIVARVRLENARRALARVEELHKTGLVGGEELRTKRTAVEIREIELREAELDPGPRGVDLSALAKQKLAVQLKSARDAAQVAKAHMEIGVAGPRELYLAEAKVAELEAEMKGDPVAAAQARLEAARRLLAELESLSKAGIAGADELRKAKSEVEIREIEVREAASAKTPRDR